eukprot:GHVP01056714.1.p1 GENE.GHVP01056714.1~~GHVP01056714.1.p1  ORF type:complete len:1247 (+),score=270.07 GHVP01056714.1:592-4332(+)
MDVFEKVSNRIQARASALDDEVTFSEQKILSSTFVEIQNVVGEAVVENKINLSLELFIHLLAEIASKRLQKDILQIIKSLHFTAALSQIGIFAIEESLANFERSKDSSHTIEIQHHKVSNALLKILRFTMSLEISEKEDSEEFTNLVLIICRRVLLAIRLLVTHLQANDLRIEEKSKMPNREISDAVCDLIFITDSKRRNEFVTFLRYFADLPGLEIVVGTSIFKFCQKKKAFEVVKVLPVLEKIVPNMTPTTLNSVVKILLKKSRENCTTDVKSQILKSIGSICCWLTCQGKSFEIIREEYTFCSGLLSSFIKEEFRQKIDYRKISVSYIQNVVLFSSSIHSTLSAHFQHLFLESLNRKTVEPEKDIFSDKNSDLLVSYCVLTDQFLSLLCRSASCDPSVVSILETHLKKLYQSSLHPLLTPVIARHMRFLLSDHQVLQSMLGVVKLFFETLGSKVFEVDAMLQHAGTSFEASSLGAIARQWVYHAKNSKEAVFGLSSAYMDRNILTNLSRLSAEEETTSDGSFDSLDFVSQWKDLMSFLLEELICDVGFRAQSELFEEGDVASGKRAITTFGAAIEHIGLERIWKFPKLAIYMSDSTSRMFLDSPGLWTLSMAGDYCSKSSFKLFKESVSMARQLTISAQAADATSRDEIKKVVSQLWNCAPAFFKLPLDCREIQNLDFVKDMLEKGKQLLDQNFDSSVVSTEVFLEAQTGISSIINLCLSVTPDSGSSDMENGNFENSEEWDDVMEGDMDTHTGRSSTTGASSRTDYTTTSVSTSFKQVIKSVVDKNVALLLTNDVSKFLETEAIHIIRGLFQYYFGVHQFSRNNPSGDSLRTTTRTLACVGLLSRFCDSSDLNHLLDRLKDENFTNLTIEKDGKKSEDAVAAMIRNQAFINLHTEVVSNLHGKDLTFRVEQLFDLVDARKKSSATKFAGKSLFKGISNSLKKMLLLLEASQTIQISFIDPVWRNKNFIQKILESLMNFEEIIDSVGSAFCIPAETKYRLASIQKAMQLVSHTEENIQRIYGDIFGAQIGHILSSLLSLGCSQATSVRRKALDLFTSLCLLAEQAASIPQISEHISFLLATSVRASETKLQVTTTIFATKLLSLFSTSLSVEDLQQFCEVFLELLKSEQRCVFAVALKFAKKAVQSVSMKNRSSDFRMSIASAFSSPCSSHFRDDLRRLSEKFSDEVKPKPEQKSARKKGFSQSKPHQKSARKRGFPQSKSHQKLATKRGHNFGLVELKQGGS